MSRRRPRGSSSDGQIEPPSITRSRKYALESISSSELNISVVVPSGKDALVPPAVSTSPRVDEIDEYDDLQDVANDESFFQMLQSLTSHKNTIEEANSQDVYQTGFQKRTTSMRVDKNTLTKAPDEDGDIISEQPPKQTSKNPYTKKGRVSMIEPKSIVEKNNVVKLKVPGQQSQASKDGEQIRGYMRQNSTLAQQVTSLQKRIQEDQKRIQQLDIENRHRQEQLGAFKETRQLDKVEYTKEVLLAYMDAKKSSKKNDFLSVYPELEELHTIWEDTSSSTSSNIDTYQDIISDSEDGALSDKEHADAELLNKSLTPSVILQQEQDVEEYRSLSNALDDELRSVRKRYKILETSVEVAKSEKEECMTKQNTVTSAHEDIVEQYRKMENISAEQGMRVIHLESEITSARTQCSHYQQKYEHMTDEHTKCITEHHELQKKYTSLYDTYNTLLHTESNSRTRCIQLEGEVGHWKEMYSAEISHKENLLEELKHTRENIIQSSQQSHDRVEEHHALVLRCREQGHQYAEVTEAKREVEQQVKILEHEKQVYLSDKDAWDQERQGYTTHNTKLNTEQNEIRQKLVTQYEQMYVQERELHQQSLELQQVQEEFQHTLEQRVQDTTEHTLEMQKWQEFHLFIQQALSSVLQKPLIDLWTDGGKEVRQRQIRVCQQAKLQPIVFECIELFVHGTYRKIGIFTEKQEEEVIIPFSVQKTCTSTLLDSKENVFHTKHKSVDTVTYINTILYQHSMLLKALIQEHTVCSTSRKNEQVMQVQDQENHIHTLQKQLQNVTLQHNQQNDKYNRLSESFLQCTEEGKDTHAKQQAESEVNSSIQREQQTSQKQVESQVALVLQCKARILRYQSILADTQYNTDSDTSQQQTNPE